MLSKSFMLSKSMKSGPVHVDNITMDVSVNGNDL